MNKKTKIIIGILVIGIVYICYNVTSSYGAAEQDAKIANMVSPNNDIAASVKGKWVNIVNNGKTRYLYLDVTIDDISIVPKEIWLNHKEVVSKKSIFGPGDKLNIFLNVDIIDLNQYKLLEVKSFGFVIFSADTCLYTGGIDNVVVPARDISYSGSIYPIILSYLLLIGIVIIILGVIFGFWIFIFKREKRDK